MYTDLSFGRNCHVDIHSGCTSLHSYQQLRSVLITPYPHQHKLSVVFLILTILTGIRWVLICISLMAKNVELCFKCFSAI